MTNRGTEDCRTGFALDLWVVIAREATISELSGGHVAYGKSESCQYVSLFIGFARDYGHAAFVWKLQRLIGFAGRPAAAPEQPQWAADACQSEARQMQGQ